MKAPIYADMGKILDAGGYKNTTVAQPFNAMQSNCISLNAYFLLWVLVCRTGRQGVDIILVWIKGKNLSQSIQIQFYWSVNSFGHFISSHTAGELCTVKHHHKNDHFIISQHRLLRVQLHSGHEQCVYKVKRHVFNPLLLATKPSLYRDGNSWRGLWALCDESQGL